MRARFFTLTLGCILLLSSCRSEPKKPVETPKASEPAGEAVVASLVDLGGVNPLTVRPIAFTSEVLDLLFLNLFEEQPDFQDHPPSFRPALASGWELSEDRRVLTVHLRRDARWSDGTPVTAEDVVFSWKAQTHPHVAWAYAGSKDRIREVVALDPHTVRFLFDQAYPYQLVDANDGKILPHHAWGKVPFEKWRGSADWFEAHLVTSGPFRLAAWKRNQELVLVPNRELPPSEVPRLARLRFRVLPDPAVQVEQLLLGKVDYLPQLTPDLVRRLEGVPEVELLSYEGRQYEYICWNTSRQPFDDPVVRRALTLAIDREELIQTLWGGYARIAVGPIPSNFWAAHRELRPWPYDPEESLRLLASRGFRRNGRGKLVRNGRPLQFELLSNAGNSLRSHAAVLIQAQLARIGVEVLPRALEIQALTELNQRGEFDATLSGWAVDTTLDLKPYFHSEGIENGLNFGRYRNPDVDRLIDEVRQLPNLEQAKPVYFKIQEILHQAQPYTFLWEPRRLAAVRKGLHGVEPHALSALGSAPRWWKIAEPSVQ
jgi:peptide/nickel transport system substrate-binding protein